MYKCPLLVRRKGECLSVGKFQGSRAVSLTQIHNPSLERGKEHVPSVVRDCSQDRIEDGEPTLALPGGT